MQGDALKRVLILDTCGSGGAVDLFQASSRNPFAFRGLVERLSRSQGIHMIAATAASQLAHEPEELGHGVLIYSLLAALGAVEEGPLKEDSLQIDSADNVVGLLDWFNYADRQVSQLTKQLYRQEQNVHMSIRGENFPILLLTP